MSVTILFDALEESQRASGVLGRLEPPQPAASSASIGVPMPVAPAEEGRARSIVGSSQRTGNRRQRLEPRLLATPAGAPLRRRPMPTLNSLVSPESLTRRLLGNSRLGFEAGDGRVGPHPRSVVDVLNRGRFHPIVGDEVICQGKQT